MVEDIYGGFYFIGIIFEVLYVDDNIIILYANFEAIFVGDSG